MPGRAVVVEKCNRWPNAQPQGYGPSGVSRTPLGLGQGFNPLALGIVRHICFRQHSFFSDVWRGNLFSFVKLLFGEVCLVPQKVRNIDG
jgi:hypothetical protein